MGENIMESYEFLLSLAIILLSTKVFGLITEKVHLPQVVGAILAGVILGPSCFGILEQSDFLIKASEIGVIMLMFIAGLDTDLQEIKKTGPAACLIAVLGVFVPIIMCSGVYWLFFADRWDFTTVIRAVFVGVVFAATSVSITVETLNEMGKLKSRVGTTLLSAAIIDDIIGVIVLSIVSGLGGANTVSPLRVIIQILLFFIFTVIIGFAAYYLFKLVSKKHGRSRRIAVWALAFCFIMSYCAEKFFGVADITGAFFAGVILCNLSKSRQFVAKKMTVASYMVFTPIFFAGIGIKTDLRNITGEIIIFAAVLLIAAIISKIVGCGLAAKISGMSRRESLSVGVGMVARGEVALMVAQKGIDAGCIAPGIFPAIVFVVIIAALLTPGLLKLSFRDSQGKQTLDITAKEITD